MMWLLGPHENGPGRMPESEGRGTLLRFLLLDLVCTAPSLDWLYLIFSTSPLDEPNSRVNFTDYSIPIDSNQNP